MKNIRGMRSLTRYDYGIADEMPWSGKDAEIWNEFLKDIEKIEKKDLANLPVEDFDKKILELDNITAFEYMKNNGLTQKMIYHIDLYARSCFGEPSGKISAAAFLNFISGDIRADAVIMAVASRHLPKLIKDLPAGKKALYLKFPMPHISWPRSFAKRFSGRTKVMI